MRNFGCHLHSFKLLWIKRNSWNVLVSGPSSGYSYLKVSFKSVHSFRQFKQEKSSGNFQTKKNLKYLKSKEKEDVDTKVYMRDTVAKIYTILKYSTWDSALDQLQRLPIRWDSYTVNQVLKTHPPMEKAWLFFNWVAGLKGFKHDQFTYTTMLDIFGEAGGVSSMNYVFKQMQESGINIDAVTYTSLMHWISSSGDVDVAVKVWEEMKNSGCSPTVVSYTAYMKLLFHNNRVKEATGAYKEMLQSGLSPNCHTYTVLMEYLIESGKCEEALEVFSKMQEAEVQPDKAACNILVEKLSRSGETLAMSKIFNYMKENHIVLRYLVFVEASKALKAAGESDFLLTQVNPHCSIESASKDSGGTTQADNPLTADEGLILILLKKENLVCADSLLAGIADKNTQLDPAIISTIIEVNCDQCRLSGALLAFDYSVKTGIIIPRNTYLTLIGALIRSSLFPKVVEAVEAMIKAGHLIGIYFASILLYKFGHARKPKYAARIFNLLPDGLKCTATYTALIGVYFSAGNFDKGLEIFKTMQRNGNFPSLGTYNVLIDGLSRSGRVSELEDLWKEKKRFHAHDGHSQDIKPFEEKICDLLFVRDVVS
ncbi:pentatricopeptide repeat-containing protein At2g01390 [Morus notabilis]|nr:pentatricopeptide repeat-containing protein At2g01390 [Morus notabilis]